MSDSGTSSYGSLPSYHLLRGLSIGGICTKLEGKKSLLVRSVQSVSQGMEKAGEEWRKDLENQTEDVQHKVKLVVKRGSAATLARHISLSSKSFHFCQYKKIK